MIKPLTQINFDFDGTGEPADQLIMKKADMQEKEKSMAGNPVAGFRKKQAVEKTAAASPPPDEKQGKRGRRSLKEVNNNSDLVSIPEDAVLFKKQYYSIGEVAAMFHENQSLIRYWETEFDILQPRKNRKGDRFFRPVDIKNLVLIYDLLRRRKFTIEGAKDYLKKNKNAEEKFALIRSMENLKGFLLELKANL